MARPVRANYLPVYEEYQFVPNVHVYEPSEEPVFTGLLDHLERPLYSIPERQPIGFIPHKA